MPTSAGRYTPPAAAQGKRRTQTLRPGAGQSAVRQNYINKDIEYPGRVAGWMPEKRKKADLMFVQHLVPAEMPVSSRDLLRPLPGSNGFSGPRSGGVVAALLNPRLMAAIPPELKRHVARDFIAVDAEASERLEAGGSQPLAGG